jgi:hypothetical protein
MKTQPFQEVSTGEDDGSATISTPSTLQNRGVRRDKIGSQNLFECDGMGHEGGGMTTGHQGHESGALCQRFPINSILLHVPFSHAIITMRNDGRGEGMI